MAVGRWARLWVILVFAGALVTRLLPRTAFLSVDEDQWMERGVNFLLALLQGDAGGTYLRHHPGVTNMWLVAVGLTSRYLLRSALPSGDLARQSVDLLSYLRAIASHHPIGLTVYADPRIVFGVVTAACVAGIYELSRRLFGSAVAALAAAILILEPFFLGYQRLITTDANQTNFTWLALLAFLLYARMVAGQGQHARHWLLFSGACFGLAVLSKIPALFSLPVFVLLMIRLARKAKPGVARRRLALDVILWGAVAAGAMALLWPALRTDPVGTLHRLYEGLGSEVGGHQQFFLGQSTPSPGLAFYPVVLAFRLSPLLLLGSILGLSSLSLPAMRCYLHDRFSLVVICLNCLLVLVASSVFATKFDRYIIPIVPGLALLAASGVWAGAEWLRETGARDPRRRGLFFHHIVQLPVLLLLVLVLQSIVALPHVPYYLTYFNPLLGGPARAQKLLEVGNGELLDRAAAWLNQQATPERRFVATNTVDSFEPYYRGPAARLPGSGASLLPMVRANYVVLYVNAIQRNKSFEAMRYFLPQKPLHTVSAHGVDYAHIYRGPSVPEVDLAAVEQRTDLQLAENARLLGYELETPTVTAGQIGVLALYWQALEPFPARDFAVHLAIKDDAGNEWGSADSEPVGGMLPVDQWQPGEILRDVHQVTVPPGTPPGEYNLDVSFWSPTLQRALEIRDSGTPLGRHVALTKLRVSQPTQTPELAGDLQIPDRVQGDVRVAAEAARLVGYERPEFTAVRAGDAIPLVLLWQAGTHELGDVQLLLRLSQGGQYWQRTAGHPLGGSYAPGNWIAGELVRDIWVALLPADVPGGRYQLELVAHTANGDKVLLDLGSVDVLARDHDFTEPRPQFPQEASLGNVARFRGYAMPDVVQPGQALTVTLYWEALGESEHNYTRFVHVLDSDNRIVAQQDGVPDSGEMPLTSWLVGEQIRDDLQIALPAEMPPGAYRLAVGMYDSATGRRLTTQDDQEQILLSRQLDVR